MVLKAKRNISRNQPLPRKTEKLFTYGVCSNLNRYPAFCIPTIIGINAVLYYAPYF